MPYAFTDLKRITKLHIPAANMVVRIEVPKGPSTNVITSKSQACLKRGTFFMASSSSYKLDPGPLEPSILTEQLTHRSRDIWDGSVDMVLNIRKSDRGFWKLIEKYPIHPRVLEVIRLSGLYGVYRCNRPTIDRSLITSLVEWWRPETHTFHFRTGEATITLQDVEVLYGLLVNGAPMIAGMMMADTSGAYLKLMYLSMLKDVNAIGSYSWGSATLAYLYRFLCKVSQSTQNEIAGFLPLLQDSSINRFRRDKVQPDQLHPPICRRGKGGVARRRERAIARDQVPDEMNEMDEAMQNSQIGSEDDQATTNHDFGSTSMGCTQEFTQASASIPCKLIKVTSSIHKTIPCELIRRKEIPFNPVMWSMLCWLVDKSSLKWTPGRNCNVPKIKFRDATRCLGSQYDVVPPDTVSVSSLGKRSTVEEQIKKKNPTVVKISPWTLARLNSEDVLKAAVENSPACSSKELYWFHYKLKSVLFYYGIS
ncbi:putative strictosidine synthase 1-like [Capsicum annuum]|nr:putative strictosidine synthase 1-like [Capsicum annuum]